MEPSRLLQVRLKHREYDHLKGEADRRGATMSELVRTQLGALLGGQESARESKASKPHDASAVVAPAPLVQAPERSPDLPQRVHELTGKPLALCRRWVDTGRVEVREGEIYVGGLRLGAELHELAL